MRIHHPQDPGLSRLRWLNFGVCIGAIAIIAGLVGDACDAQKISFNQHVRPIFSDRCFTCHGPDGKERVTDTRFDQPVGLDKVIVPGDPDSSELIRRLESEDESLRMPPSHSKMNVTKEEIQLIRNWIRQGGTWEAHWAFSPIRAPSLPPSTDSNCKHPIDLLLNDGLNKKGLAMSEKATPENRLRRVTFDLTGVSPTLAELDQFLANPSDAAYEQAVDRLLASPRFGERMASIWLDLARYSDTYGYQVDRERFVWPWRDWVVRAYNSNLPFDQFATQQIAGDLLPNPSQDQILATTFNRLHPQKVEGGSIEEEFRVEYVADRVHAFGTVFLGLTIECARCHDHKFDPISMDEYYQLFAFFNNIDEAGLYSFFDAEAVPTPALTLLDAQKENQLKKLQLQVFQAEQALAECDPELAAQFLQWLADQPKRRVELEADANFFATQLNVQMNSLGLNQLIELPGNPPVIKLTGDDEIRVDGGRFERDQPFSVFARIKIPQSEETLDRNVVFHCSTAWTDSASRGYQVLIEEGKLSAALIHFWPGNAIGVRTKQTLATNRWLDIALCYDGSSKAKGIKLYVDGELQEVDVVRDGLTRTILGHGTDHLKIGARFRDRGFKDGELSAFAFFDRELSPLEIVRLHDPQRFATWMDRPPQEFSADELKLIRDFYNARVDQVRLEARSHLQQARRSLNQFLDQQPEIMVMKEFPVRKKTYRLGRGAYNSPENEVFPRTPAMLPPMQLEPDKIPTRVDLAKWVISKENPLTARVAVNQFWQILFGSGLVRTPEDFGSQSVPPEHLELLDWLAEDFRQDWDVKRCIKQIVMSVAYQQSTVAIPDMLEKDPENHWFGRQNPTRLSAEMVRDHALLQSGLLVEEQGGPPVRPYDLELAFAPIRRDKGGSLYRRSLYTYWKRTSTSPMMVVLDAPSRDVCTVKRERTSSPLQGLLMFNGTQFVEVARKLSERMMVQHGSEPQKVCGDMFRSLTSRSPNARELSILLDLFEKQKHRFTEQPKLADELLAVGDSPSAALDKIEHAAWTTVASVILNLEESLFRR